MKISLPTTQTAPPPEVPKNIFGKLLTSTPVIMTVVSTLMAGLSNSEMSRGQYDRSTAAQLQSKVADQWSFYQARRIRSATIRSSESVLAVTVESLPLSLETLMGIAGGSSAGVQLTNVMECLVSRTIPKAPPAPEYAVSIRGALDGIASGKKDRDIFPLLASISAEQMEEALQIAQTQSAAFDQKMSELGRGLDQMEAIIQERVRTSPQTFRPLWRDFTSARMHLDALRYDAEARMIRPIADLLELQVRIGNREAERHRLRSGHFFIGMLVSQVAVVIATFALAVQRRNVIWAVAASLGLTAISFGVYVFLHD